MGARARVGLVEACRGGEARACGMFTMKIVYITHYTPYSVLQDPTYLEVRGASPAGTMRAPRGRLRGCTARPKGAGTQRCAECGRVASCRPSRRDLCCRRRRPSPSRMLSAQTATLAATTLVAVALAFYLLSKSSPEDVPATAAPPESVPAVKRAPIATAPPEAARMKSMSYAPRIAAAPTEPPARNGQAAAGRPAVPRKKKSEGEEEGGGGGGKRRSKAAAEAKAAADAKAAEAEESKGEPFVNSIISRAILKQPVDLLALANPPAKEGKPKPDGKGGKGDKGERKKSKAKPISSWGESFQVAMQTLEGSAVDAALRAQQQLTGCLVQVSSSSSSSSSSPAASCRLVVVVVAAHRLPRAGNGGSSRSSSSSSSQAASCRLVVE